MGSLPTAYSYIRFSTPHQLLGDSERRQLAAATAWAKANGYELSNATLADLGVSGFRGKNARKGVLSFFLERVRGGLIPPGSCLIVEELDRLSRQEPLNTIEIVTTLIDNGLAIGVVGKNLLLTRESIKDTGPWLTFCLSISLAHDESRNKSNRLKKTYAIRRQDATTNGKPLPGKYPFWLTREGDKFVINEHAETVKLIFNLSLEGLGRLKIVQELVRRGIKSPTNEKQWHLPRVSKLLANRAVIGELAFFETHHEKNGSVSRVPTGEVSKSYYPAVIDESTFAKVNFHRLTLKRRGGHSRTDFLTGLISCGYCGGAMSKQKCGRKEKWQFYSCKKAATKQGCTHTKMWQLDSLISTVAMLSEEASSFNSESSTKLVDLITPKILAAQTTLEQLGQAIITNPSRYLAKQIQLLENELDELEIERQTQIVAHSVTPKGGFEEFNKALENKDIQKVNAFLHNFIKPHGIMLYSEGNVPGMDLKEPHRVIVINYRNDAKHVQIETLVTKGEWLKYYSISNQAKRHDREVAVPIPRNEIIKTAYHPPASQP